MKFIQLTAIALVFFIKSQAQITKNNWMLGGTFSISQTKTSSQANELFSTQINTTPRVGYFLANRFALGILGRFDLLNLKPTLTTSSASNFGIGPFVRYYLLPVENKTNLLIEANGTYTWLKSSLLLNSSNFIDYTLLAGPVIFLNSSVGLEFLVGYYGYKETTSNSKMMSVNFSIGIQYHLEKNK
ncbi:MAG: hypothetical protein EAZ35_09385 [Sphingobacteriia bacterium]|nr:MAG: hypothetical protein EAZ35_09385 [Sphingobacteriia bacterium]